MSKSALSVLDPALEQLSPQLEGLAVTATDLVVLVAILSATTVLAVQEVYEFGMRGIVNRILYQMWKGRRRSELRPISKVMRPRSLSLPYQQFRSRLGSAVQSTLVSMREPENSDHQVDIKTLVQK